MVTASRADTLDTLNLCIGSWPTETLRLNTACLSRLKRVSPAESTVESALEYHGLIPRVIPRERSCETPRCIGYFRHFSLKIISDIPEMIFPLPIPASNLRTELRGHGVELLQGPALPLRWTPLGSGGVPAPLARRTVVAAELPGWLPGRVGPDGCAFSIGTSILTVV